ncbi:hypothetical protein [Candidatus Berkiella aquae]|uniref:Lipoprotein n=1 Tax=Candidatus Berkiella aquae TaxID=295108 RepID=A0A0Q9YJY2_9GAMM|nr:hypothetical protein [Candidatus Berkiella aquae]MCS5710105.1 hypothetical protein [Candidatus Berkiella aquae]
MNKGLRKSLTLIGLLLLGGCCRPEVISPRLQKDPGGYYYYGCCHYGIYNNPNYDRGGPCNRGCYHSDCSPSVWR